MLVVTNKRANIAAFSMGKGKPSMQFGPGEHRVTDPKQVERLKESGVMAAYINAGWFDMREISEEPTT